MSLPRPLLLTLVLLPALLAPPASAAEDDPLVAYRRQLYADKPVGKAGRQDATGEPHYKPVPGAGKSHFDVPYLGGERDRLYGVRLDQRDPRAKAGHPLGLEWRTRCDIHVPKGEGPFPTLVLVHGGSYQAGDKTGPGWMCAKGNDLRTTGMQRGWVVVSINYILGNGIHPQVQRDVRELVRFLRANADTYRVDPHRIGMLGCSAGGWLTGASSLTTVDDGWVFGPGWQYRAASLDGKQSGGELLLLGDAAMPAHADRSARLSVILCDFIDGMKSASPDDPHVFGFADPGGKEQRAVRQKSGLLMTRVVLSKKGVHVPDNDQPVASAAGEGQVSLFERSLQFIETYLVGPEAQSPAPEARPNARWFADRVEVSLVGSGPGAVIRYTTDGSEPTAASPVYEKPFPVSATTTVKAIATAPGMQPSGAMTATFLKGTPPPAITGPEGLVLPPARVGQPYEVTFTAPGAARWMVLMQSSGNPAGIKLPPSAKHAAAQLAKVGLGVFNGLPMQAQGESCTLKGTPLSPGWATVLVAAAHAEGEGCPVAGDRLYLLRIDPIPR